MPGKIILLVHVAALLLSGCLRSDPNFKPSDPRTYEPPVYDGVDHDDGGRGGR